MKVEKAQRALIPAASAHLPRFRPSLKVSLHVAGGKKQLAELKLVVDGE